MEVTLTRVHRADKNKQGQPYINQKGNPYTRVGIQTAEHGAVWISGFGNSHNTSWKAGDKVELEITQNGQYWNFKMPPTTVTRQEFDDLKKTVSTLWEKVAKLETRPLFKEPYSEPNIPEDTTEEPELEEPSPF